MLPRQTPGLEVGPRQHTIGARAVAVGGLHGGDGLAAPVPVLMVLMFLAAALAGALLLLGPALLKARLGVDEVVTTLLLKEHAATGRMSRSICCIDMPA